MFIGSILVSEETDMLRVGELAPQFAAVTSGAEAITLAQFRGKQNVVLSFYPKDFTSGCTQQLCTYRDSISRIRELDAVLFGVSTDSDDSHRRFASTYRLPFPLISDESRALCKLYRVERLGGLIPPVKRVTYVIDKKGLIRLVAHHEFEVGTHLERILRTLEELQAEEAAAP